MRGLNGYDAAKASTGDYERLPAGGYVCKVTAVEDVPEKQYLLVKYDICEGAYSGWWKDTEERAGFWGGTFYRSYKDTAIGFFKGFISAVDDSNGTQFGRQIASGFDETALVGKTIGLILGYEEYTSNGGDIKQRIIVTGNRDVKKIRSGDFKIPELKLLAGKPAQAKQPGFTELTDDDEDLPF